MSAGGPVRRTRVFSVRSTLALLALAGTTVVVFLAVLLAVTIIPPAAAVRQSTQPVVYLVDALNADAEALDEAVRDVRVIVAEGSVADPAIAVRARTRLAALTDQSRLRGYDKVPPGIRSQLAGVDADVTQLEDRLLEVLDLTQMHRLGEARDRARLADSLQIVIRRDLTVAGVRAGTDLLAREVVLDEAGHRATRLAVLVALAGAAFSALYLGVLRQRVDRPLAELGEALERVERGDLTTSLPVRRPDEMGRLAEHFNAMTAVMAATRRRDEEALRRSEEDFRGLVENASVGIYRSTREGRFLTANPALVRMLGYDSEEEVLRLDIARDVFADPAQRARVVSSHTPPGELKLKRRDGTLITVQVQSRVVPGGDGRPDFFEGVMQDVTEQRALESQLRQSQRLEAVGRLAGGVAHDFNNILTAIIGYSELLLDELAASHPLRPSVQEIRAGADRAASLTRQLLAFSRKQVLRAKVLDLNTAVRDLVKMLQRLIGEDVKLELALHAAPAMVQADPGQVEQVLLNLAVNARDAMPDGGRLTLETACRVLDETYARAHADVVPGEYVMLAVSDTGTGMDAETQARIFEPFFTTKELGKGTGLGLSTVYGIVKQSGGSIAVYSEPGRGTTFKIYLPRVDAPAPVETAASAPPARGGHETVLLAEDDAAVREVAGEALSQRGYRVLRAPDGQTALELAAAHAGEIAILVTDLVMPGMSGRELAEALTALRPGLQVLYISGYTDDAVVRHGILAEGLAYLQKPFSAEALAAKVRQVVDACR